MKINVPVPDFILSMYKKAKSQVETNMMFPAQDDYEGGWDDGYEQGVFEALEDVIKRWQQWEMGL